MRDYMKSLALLTVVGVVALVAMAAQDRPVTGEIEYFNVTASTAGDNAIITGIADQRFKIYDIVVTSTSSTADTFCLQSGATDLWYREANRMTVDMSGITGPQGISRNNQGGVFETVDGEDFTINLELGNDVNVQGSYMIIKTP